MNHVGVTYANVAGAGKVVCELLVERERHDAVGGIKGLLDGIAVQRVEVDVKNALKISANQVRTKSK